jgi:hypothetical protein
MLLIMQSYSVSCYFIPLRPKHLLHHPVLSHTPSSYVHSRFLTNLWPIPLNTAVNVELSASTLPHISVLKYISLQTDITYLCQNDGADDLMVLNGGIHLSKAVAITRD